MSVVTLSSPAILQRPANSWPNGNTIDLLRPIVADIEAINTNNGSEASLAANTFTGIQTFGLPNTYNSATTMTALAGGAQAGTALPNEYNDFTVVATALDSAQLPAGILGTVRFVKNSAALPMAVFGQTGASIDSGSANASVVVGPGETIKFTAVSATLWKSNVARLDIATNVITEQITLTATEIVGTAAGDLGHANGATLVAGVSSAYAMEFVSAILIYDFDTAAYTGGGNDLVVCIGSGGATLSGATTAANLLGAAGDKIVSVYPLTTAGNPLSVGTGLSLKSTAWTNPGTAAGVVRCQVSYRLHKTNL